LFYFFLFDASLSTLQQSEELQAYAAQAKYVDRSYPFFASQKSVKAGFSANSLAQTFALLYEGAGLF
jgi:integrase/recombinase XerD